LNPLFNSIVKEKRRQPELSPIAYICISKKAAKNAAVFSAPPNIILEISFRKIFNGGCPQCGTPNKSAMLQNLGPPKEKFVPESQEASAGLVLLYQKNSQVKRGSQAVSFFPAPFAKRS